MRMRQVFIESKNSELFLVCFSLSIRNSIASIAPIGFRIRRRTYIFFSCAGSIRSSSLGSRRLTDHTETDCRPDTPEYRPFYADGDGDGFAADGAEAAFESCLETNELHRQLGSKEGESPFCRFI